VMYTPQSRPSLRVERLLTEELMLVRRTGLNPSPLTRQDANPDYVHVNWGPEFFDQHSLSFPDMSPPPITVGIGWIGLRYIVKYGGSGFFPQRFIRPFLDDGTLEAVPDAPRFSMPAYLVYAEDPAEVVQQAIAVLREVSSRQAT
jgi:LysR family transcriptional regulator, flagellar master operon regulator